LAVAQWAQDSGKAGRDGADGPVVLIPRYASRGEVGAEFIPGESFLAGGLAAAGLRIAQSPLLFQGGNLLAVRERSDGPLTLIVGEAEVWRNTTLGLSAEQVREALAAEFGAARCLVLPAVSFHADMDVSIRAAGPGTMAFGADEPGAARIGLGCALGVLERSGLIPASPAARAELEAGRPTAAMALVGECLARSAIGPGRWPESFASAFSA